MTIDHKAGPIAASAVITVHGEIDLYTATAFHLEVDKELNQGCKRLLLDLAGLDYLDSSGVGVLIRALQKAKTIGARLGLAGTCGTPLKVLQLSNIASLFTFYPSVDDAKAFWN